MSEHEVLWQMHFKFLDYVEIFCDQNDGNSNANASDNDPDYDNNNWFDGKNNNHNGNGANYNDNCKDKYNESNKDNIDHCIYSCKCVASLDVNTNYILLIWWRFVT